TLARVAEDGGTLVPHFRALLEDVFCLLFKLEPRLRPAEAVAPAAALGRTLLEAFHGHPLLEHLRERTQLDETQAGLGTLLIAEQVLAMLREEALLPRGDLLDLWDLERRGGAVRELGHRPRRRRRHMAEAEDRARPAARHPPQAPEARRRRRPHARAGARAPPESLRARQRGDLRGAPRERPGASPPARAARAPPPSPAPRLRPPPGRGPPPLVLAPRRRPARPRPDDRLPRRLGLDGGRQGDLVEGGRPDPPRDRTPAAPALPLHLLLVGRHAALHPRLEPARAPRGAG